MKKRVVALVLVLASLAVAGCDYKLKKDRETSPAPTEPVIVQYSLGGNCFPAAVKPGTIVCEDTSWSDPTGQLGSIKFILREESGVALSTLSVNPKESAPREAIFGNLAFGFYDVEHVLVLVDGTTDRRTYRGISVSAF